jgi:hypothetical protein
MYLTRHYAMKTFGGGGWMYRFAFLTLALVEGGVVSFTSRPLHPHGKMPWHPLDRRLGGPIVGLQDVEKILDLTGILTPTMCSQMKKKFRKEIIECFSV